MIIEKICTFITELFEISCGAVLAILAIPRDIKEIIELRQDIRYLQRKRN